MTRPGDKQRLFTSVVSSDVQYLHERRKDKNLLSPSHLFFFFACIFIQFLFVLLLLLINDALGFGFSSSSSFFCCSDYD